MAIINRRQSRRRRHRQLICHYHLVDRQNPLENLPKCEVFQRFRFRPQTIFYIVALLNPFIQRDTLRNSPLNPILQVLITLRYLATGGFYSLISDTFSSISPTPPPPFAELFVMCVTHYANCLGSLSRCHLG